MFDRHDFAPKHMKKVADKNVGMSGGLSS